MADDQPQLQEQLKEELRSLVLSSTWLGSRTRFFLQHLDRRYASMSGVFVPPSYDLIAALTFSDTWYAPDWPGDKGAEQK